MSHVELVLVLIHPLIQFVDVNGAVAARVLTESLTLPGASGKINSNANSFQSVA
jgi:hypothetical protein